MSNPFHPKYNIGQAVWHAQGVYQLRQQVMIQEIRIHYNEDGALSASYLMDKYKEGYGQLWYPETILFDKLSDLNDTLQNRDDNNSSIS